jgi:hypothetical protein
MAGMIDMTANVTPTPVGLTDGAVFRLALPSEWPILEIHNESPFRVIVGSDNGRGKIGIPPTCVLHDLDVQKFLLDSAVTSGIIVTFTAEALLGGSPFTDPVSNQIKVFAVKWPTGDMRVTSLVRQANTGVLTSQRLQGAGQSLYLTEQDNAGIAGLAPAPAANNSLSLLVCRPGGTYYSAIDCIGGNPGSITFYNPMVTGTVFQVYAGLGTVGYGLPVIVAGVSNQLVSSTALTNIFDYLTIFAGFYRLNMHCIVNNGVSPNAILAGASYTDQNSTNGFVRMAAISQSGTTVVVLDGSTTRTNQDYACMPYTFYAASNTHIICQYRDLTNTPNDRVTAYLEALSQ